MRIGYLAKHDSGGNDDEGAITFALEALGHRVERLREKRAYIADYSLSGKAWADEMSWERLRPKYVELLEGLCKT